MLDLDEMSSKEIPELLQQVRHGHLGCVFEGHPYVLPMHYSLQDSDIYIFTTVGMKTKYIDTNPEVCLQVEEVGDFQDWRSVGERASRTPHGTARHRSRDAIGQTAQPHTFTRHQSHLH
ncbi:pyridoxamine 5'-phosphate oxidase family protein [Microcoleus vaginatus DQ-U2]|uniref:pyridoxamine 5'-phosphate oxidase family protein n=1 Tax=Microcoleus vaginatus TaxID=119532 RepID=UPI0032AC7477